MNRMCQWRSPAPPDGLLLYTPTVLSMEYFHNVPFQSCKKYNQSSPYPAPLPPAVCRTASEISGNHIYCGRSHPVLPADRLSESLPCFAYRSYSVRYKQGYVPIFPLFSCLLMPVRQFSARICDHQKYLCSPVYHLIFFSSG